MCLYLNWMCYSERMSIEAGKNAVYGVEYAFPLCRKRLFNARADLAAWAGFALVGEGQPVPWEGVGGIAEDMRKRGDAEGADLCEIFADMYVRESDWDMMRDVDVSYHPKYGVAVQLGVPERGESTKTGVRQGIRPDRPAIAEKLLWYKARAEARGGGRLFDHTPSTFYRSWNVSCANSQYDPGPPHVLRHTGPSFDMLEDEFGRPYRTLVQVQVRGRWRAKTSVTRYGKTHVYIRALGEVPVHVRQLGESRLRALGERPVAAKA